MNNVDPYDHHGVYCVPLRPVVMHGDTSCVNSAEVFKRESLFALIIDNRKRSMSVIHCRCPLNNDMSEICDMSSYCRYNPFRRKLIDKERSQNASPG